MFVQREILQGTFELVWSYMMDFENSVNPYENRKRAIAKWQNVV